jgi:hypothetical protein
MWYFAHSMGGHRTTFCGCGIAGNLGAAFESVLTESLRPAPPSSSLLMAASVRPASVGVRMSLCAPAAFARCSCSERTNASGSWTAACLSSSSALRSRLLFSRCICSSDIADRRAMASGFSLSEMGTEGGCCLKVVGAGAGAGAGAGRGGGSLRGRESERSRGASWATVVVGVMGETGGRSEVGDSERFSPEVLEASLLDVGRRSVLRTSAGMAAEGGVVLGRCAREASGD